MSPLNVAIYVRVSTQEQKIHGISVDAQDAACRSWVQEHCHHLVGVYNDAGLSARAKYTKRHAMLQLLADIKTGKIDLIIFTKLDRWFRNVADYYEVQAILEANNVKWRAIQEDYETETASGRFKVNIMLAVAQDEADRTSERITAMHAFKKTKGEVSGPPPIGYKTENKHFVINDAVRPAIDAFFSTYSATFSTRKAMEAAAEHGVILNKSHACRMLASPVYAGDAHGVPCPAYITKEQFARHRSYAETNTRFRENPSRRVYLFSGLLRCGSCGGNMVSHAVKSGSLKYYMCSNRQERIDGCRAPAYVNERKLEAFLMENLSGILEECKAKSDAPSPKDNSNALIRETERLSRLKELYIDGEIDRIAYDKRAKEIRQRIDELTEDPTQPIRTELPDGWTTLYSTLPDDGKKTFWKQTIKKILIRKDAPPQIFFY